MTSSPTASLADHIRSEAAAAERSIRWLAGKVGTPYSTLRYQLEHPENITVLTAARIAAALDIPLTRLVPDALVERMIADMASPKAAAA